MGQIALAQLDEREYHRTVCRSFSGFASMSTCHADVPGEDSFLRHDKLRNADGTKLINGDFLEDSISGCEVLM